MNRRERPEAGATRSGDETRLLAEPAAEPRVAPVVDPLVAPAVDPAFGPAADDLLAGATIITVDPAAVTTRAESAQRGAPMAIDAGGAPGWQRWRLYGGGALLVVCLGLYGWQAWRGRAPAAVAVQPLRSGDGAEVRVYVEGAVAQPGVYRLLQGDRVEDAIRAAGGLTPDADGTRVNLAQRVRDEQKLAVPTNPAGGSRLSGANAAGEAGPAEEATPAAAAAAQEEGAGTAGRPSRTTGSGQGGRPAATAKPEATRRPTATAKPQPTAKPETTAKPEATHRPTAAPSPQPSQVAGEPGKVNVNTATAAQLAALPGLGDVSARRIVAYREANGPYRSLEQVRLAGVSEALLRRAAPFLSVE